MATDHNNQQWLLELLERYGRNLHSFMVLEPGLKLWRGDDAAIAYVQRGGYWIAVGGPLCHPERSLAVAESFRSDASRARCKVVFFGVTQPLVDRLAETDFDCLQIGLAPAWQPCQWDGIVRQASKLRNRLNKAARDGIRVRPVDAREIQDGSELRAQIVRLADDWSASKALPPMGFMVTLELFQHADRRRYFIAECNGRLHGLAVCIPVYGRKGWLLEDMLIAPSAPRGCSEALVDAVMRSLEHEQAELVSLGLVALAGLEGSKSAQRHPWLAWLLRFSSRTMGWLYNFEGLYRFRKKMQPTRWEPVYIVAGSRITLLTVRAILMAFAKGWVPRFGLHVLGHWVCRPHRSAESPGEIKPKLDLRTFGLACFSVALVVVAVLGVRFDWFSIWISLALGTLGAYTGFTPVHEAVHGNVSRWPTVNDCVGHLATALLTGAYLPYVHIHREHHIHTNDQLRDPDVWSGRGGGCQLPLRWATQDIGYLQFYLGQWRSRPLLERFNLIACASIYTTVAVVTLLCWPGWFVALCIGWFVPARLALFILAATFSWLPHEPHRETVPIKATSVRSSTWLTWALLGQNFHLVHHLDPRIPFYRLSNAWEEQRANLIEQGARDRSHRS